MSSSKPSGNQTVSNEPWKQIQPQVLGALPALTSLLSQPQQFYPGSTVAPVSPMTAQGLRGVASRASGPSATDAAMGSYSALLSRNPLGDASSALERALAGPAASGTGNAARSTLTGLLGDQTGPASSVLNSLLTGKNKIVAPTVGASSISVGAENPYLDEMWDQAANRAEARLASQFAGTGRLNSGAYQRAFADSLGEAGAQVYGQSAEAQANRRLQADMANQQAALQASLANQQASLTGQQTGLQALLSAAGLGQSAFDTAQARRMSASGQLLNDEANQYGQGLQGLSAYGSAYGSLVSPQLQALGLAPTLDRASYIPSEALIGAGNTARGIEQDFINADIDRFNFAQNEPWQNIQRFLGTIGYGTTPYNTQSQPLYRNQASGFLGGAATGASMGSMFGPWGAAIGGVGGGLLGLM